jgi:integrative and conjugative element protein (TIGR02256 family)
MTTAEDNSASRTVVHAGLRIDPNALSTATHLALAALPRETGGILVGWHEEAIVVVAGMLAVPDKKAGRRHYVRNHKHAQKVLDAHRHTCDDDRVGYVGEWHSHPAPQPPSSVDYNALAELTRDTSDQVALVVLAVHPDNQVTPVGATARRIDREVTITDVTIESRDHD